MKRLLLAAALLVALFWVRPAGAAIAFVGAGSHDCSGSAVTTCTVTYTSTGGNAVCLITSSDSTAGSITSVTASGGGGTFAQKVTTTVASDAVKGELWCATAVNASTSFAVNYGASNSFTNAIVLEYSGVLAFGNVTSKDNDPGVTTHGPLTVTLQQANNFITGGWPLGNVNLMTITTGTSRCNLRAGGTACVAGTNSVNVAADNTAASITTVSINATSASETSAGVAVELCQSSPCSGGATQTGWWNWGAN